MKIEKKPILIAILILFLFKPGVCEESTKKEDEKLLSQLLEAKISTAAKYEQKVSEAPASVTIITSEDIERFGYRTLDEILMRVRGFYTTNDHNYSFVGIRGFSPPDNYNNRVLLLINGLSITDNVFGVSYIGTELGLDVDAIERIEIVRGPGSVLYGTRAMLAVINIITKKGKTVDSVRLTLQPGSFGKIQGGIQFGKELKNGLDIFVSAHLADIKGQDLYFEEFDDPATNNGIAEELDWEKYYGIFTTLKYKNVSLQAIMSAREKGIPTASFNTAFNDPRAKFLEGRHFIELKYEKNINYNTKIMARGFFSNSRYKGEYPYDLAGFRVLGKDKSSGDLIGFESKFNWDIKANNRLIVGIEYINNIRGLYKAWDDYRVISDINVHSYELSFYIHDEYQMFKNLFLTLGVRYDHYSAHGDWLSPKAALIYNPSSAVTFKFLYGNAYRTPNIYEMYYEDPINGVITNPLLEREKTDAYEVVAEHSFNKWMIGTLSLYRFEMKGLIDWAVDPSDGFYKPQNIEKVRANGIEAGLNVRLKKGFKGYVNYSFQNNKNVALDEKIANSPSHLFKLGLSLPLFKHFFTSVETFYESNRITVYGTRTKSYLLTNVHLSSGKLFNHFKFSLQIRNLFDRAYRTPGGYEHIQESFLQKGRNVTLKLEYIF